MSATNCETPVLPPKDPALLAGADWLFLAASRFAAACGASPSEEELAADRLVALAERLGCETPTALARLWCDAESAFRDLDADLALAEHHRLFGEAGGCSPYEGAWIRRDKGPLLADVGAFQRAFGLELNEGTDQRPDHLVAELELLAFLLLHAAKAQDAEAKQVSWDAARSFAIEHLGEWIHAFTANLATLAASPAWLTTAMALEKLWSELVRLLELPPPSAAAAPVTPELKEELEPTSGWDCNGAGSA